MNLWLKCGSVRSIAVRPPSFAGVVAARLEARLPLLGVALRLSDLDLVGRCLFVGENDIHHLILGAAPRAVAVPFGHLRDILPASAYMQHAFASFCNIQACIGPDQPVENISRREITCGDRMWARAKLPALFAAIAEADARHGTCRSLLLDWQEARKYASTGVDITARGHFRGAGIDQARRRLVGTDMLDDLDRFITFWPRERTDLAQDARRDQLRWARA